jgi:hypothetical protein
MPAHFREFRNDAKHSAAVFLVPQSLEIGIAVDQLLLLWFASAASEWRTDWRGFLFRSHDPFANNAKKNVTRTQKDP